MPELDATDRHLLSLLQAARETPARALPHWWRAPGDKAIAAAR